MQNPKNIQDILQQTLNPSAIQLDGKTEIDHLSFMSGFAHLVNFYDKNNQRHGNWSPFLLKDPVILLAYISNTRYQSYYNVYKAICGKIEKSSTANEMAAFFNELFELLYNIFHLIAQWLDFMLGDVNHYDLKKYVEREVKNTYGQYLSSIMELQQKLSMSKTWGEIKPPDPFRFHHLHRMWTEIKNKSPYFEVFGLNEGLKGDSADSIYQKFKAIADDIMGFFIRIIQNAKTYYQQALSSSVAFPDTTLVRSFVKLLQYQQQQINNISERHLDFYYTDILKQSALPAQADQVFVSTTLKEKNTCFNLPAGFEFSAGVDAKKNPIIFSAAENMVINSAAIHHVFQLSVFNDQLLFDEVETPTTVKKDESGKIESWSTFTAKTAQDVGVAFASPMLLLMEGHRDITITITLKDNSTFTQTDHITFYLSTQKKWLNITDVVTVADGAYTISLREDVEAIEAFTKNPDGISAAWPMFKMVFSKYDQFHSPPQVASIRIDVDVKKMSQFILYNDHGKLNTAKPFELFGPAPELQSNFYIGSAEVFSKPVTYLDFDITWSPLPENFKTYYKTYNQYAKDHGITYPPNAEIDIPGDDGKTVPGWLLNLVDEAIYEIQEWWKALINGTADNDDDEDGLFNNTRFKVDFFLLKEHVWSAFLSPSTDHKVYPLFDQNDKDQLQSTRSFSFALLLDEKTKKESPTDMVEGIMIQGNPQLQLTPLTFNDHTAEGFLKMSLADPKEGFGHDMYPQVVTYVSLYNAEIISFKDKEDPLKVAPSLPFVPKIKTLSGEYKASQICVFDSLKDDFQYFYYTPFGNYQVTDLASATLLNAYQDNGYVYISLTDLSFPNPVSFFFELHGGIPGVLKHKMKAQYLSAEGWKPLQMLENTTNGFRCSGIITVNIPKDIVDEHTTMPSNQYWIALSVDDDVDIFADTVYININGISLKRTSAIGADQQPSIPALAISSPLNTTPEIASVVQPFASFGGRKAEQSNEMLTRISNRLYSKGRARNPLDYYTLILQAFPEIYYLQTSKTPARLHIMLVRGYDHPNVPGAFKPKADACTIDKISKNIAQKTSGFSSTTVANMAHQEVTVSCTVKIAEGVSEQGLIKQIANGLDIYLSPWIVSSQPQRKIGEPIQKANITQYISTFSGVVEVSDVAINGSAGDLANANTNDLFISSMKHQING